MYSADSVISALKSNASVSCEGIDDVKCPFPLTHPCPAVPESCSLGKAGKCEHRVSVHRDLKMLRIIVFRFMVGDKMGFVHETDSVLVQLINHKIIDPGKLRMV